MSSNLSNRLNPTHPAFDADFKAKWDGMTRSQRRSFVEEDAKTMKEKKEEAASRLVKHPFETDEDDHCETPREAYLDIAPALAALGVSSPSQSSSSSSSPSTAPDAKGLRIYDGFYCAGAVKAHLAAAGFPNVHNEPEDFYAVAKDKDKRPDFDVFLTNPAYSGDHIPRMLDLLAHNEAFKGKPCFLLMPNWVAAKPYWAAFEKKHEPGTVFYVFPSKRYSYWTPDGLRSKKQGHASSSSDGGQLQHRTSPFISFWYCRCTSKAQADAVARAYLSSGGGGLGAGSAAAAVSRRPGVSVARRLSDLPKSIRPAAVEKKKSNNNGKGKDAVAVATAPLPTSSAAEAARVGEKRKRPDFPPTEAEDEAGEKEAKKAKKEKKEKTEKKEKREKKEGKEDEEEEAGR